MVFGLFDDIAEGVGKVIGIVVGVLIAAAVIVLGYFVIVVKLVILVGCKTVEEIKDFIDDI